MWCGAGGGLAGVGGGATALLVVGGGGWAEVTGDGAVVEAVTEESEVAVVMGTWTTLGWVC